MVAKGSRLTLVKSVLATMPLHPMVVLGLNKTKKQVDKILRGFLWLGRVAAQCGHYHVNWFKVCRPLLLGDLGVLDLGRTAISLRVCWLWWTCTDPLHPWRGLDLEFSRDEHEMFTASTKMVVSKKTTALF